MCCTKKLWIDHFEILVGLVVVSIYFDYNTNIKKVDN